MTAAPSSVGHAHLAKRDVWVIHLALSLAALYAAIIAGMYFAQTWLLFPAFFARATRVHLPESTQRLKVRTPDGESLVGLRIPAAWE